jgi:hypothetical protein
LIFPLVEYGYTINCVHREILEKNTVNKSILQALQIGRSKAEGDRLLEGEIGRGSTGTLSIEDGNITQVIGVGGSMEIDEDRCVSEFRESGVDMAGCPLRAQLSHSNGSHDPRASLAALPRVHLKASHILGILIETEANPGSERVQKCDVQHNDEEGNEIEAALLVEVSLGGFGLFMGVRVLWS